MMKKKKESRFVRDVRESVDEYLAWSKGEKRMKITHVEKNGARVQFYATGPEAKAYQDRVEEFKRTRGVLELSQSEMAELLRVSVGAVQQWEIGRRRIPETAMLVAEIARDYPEVREKIMPKKERKVVVKRSSKSSAKRSPKSSTKSSAQSAEKSVEKPSGKPGVKRGPKKPPKE